MILEHAVRPRGPYSLALSARLASDATRTFDGRRFTAVLEADGRLEAARAWQHPDGRVVLQAESEPALDRLRFVLALDDDHAPFLRRFARDPLLGETTRQLRGLRPLRLATVTQALLRALCGQLIESRRARALEWKIVRAVMPEVTPVGLHEPPTRAALARFAPSQLRALGLHARRAATLVRLCRSLDLERLRAQPTAAVAERLERERGLGPWSVGLICLQGLGRPERGLTGDLGLIKLCGAIQGRPAGPDETASLLARYGDWAGIASVYLLAGWARGLVPSA